MPTRFHLSRRALLAACAVAPLPLSRVARAADDPRLSIRAEGNPSAPVHVQEWFSLTCTHCARFDQTVFPEVKAKLIDTGKIYYVFKDFPLDQVALLAAQVARALPPERYEPFIDSLFASQDRWAFAQGVDTKAVLQQMAALAGLPADAFNAAVSDQAYREALVAERARGVTRYHIDSTPTFIFGSTVVSGEMTYEMFADHVAKASAGG